MSHDIRVWNFRKTRRAIRESNGTTVRKEVRKTEACYTRNSAGKSGEDFLKSLNPKYFKKTTASSQDPEQNQILYDSVDWKNILK